MLVWCVTHQIILLFMDIAMFHCNVSQIVHFIYCVVIRFIIGFPNQIAIGNNAIAQ